MTVVTACGRRRRSGSCSRRSRAARAQLSGFSTILILTMSALGGSMFPRFLMSETMQKIGLRDVQRVGARRVLEGVLAQGRRLAALAAGARARQRDGGLPHARALTRATVGNRVRQVLQGSTQQNLIQAPRFPDLSSLRSMLKRSAIR